MLCNINKIRLLNELKKVRVTYLREEIIDSNPLKTP